MLSVAIAASWRALFSFGTLQAEEGVVLTIYCFEVMNVMNFQELAFALLNSLLVLYFYIFIRLVVRASKFAESVLILDAICP